MYSSEDFVSLVPSGYCQGVLKPPRVPLRTHVGTTVIQTRKLYQYLRLEVKDSSIRLLSLFSDVSKYRDPLHLLLNYIAEVSTAGSLHPTIQYIPDLDVNYAASI